MFSRFKSQYGSSPVTSPYLTLRNLSDSSHHINFPLYDEVEINCPSVGKCLECNEKEESLDSVGSCIKQCNSYNDGFEVACSVVSAQDFSNKVSPDYEASRDDKTSVAAFHSHVESECGQVQQLARGAAENCLLARAVKEVVPTALFLVVNGQRNSGTYYSLVKEVVWWCFGVSGPEFG